VEKIVVGGKSLKKATFKKNLIFAFLAQGISLTMNFLMSLFVPRILNVENFSFWQLFIFYSGFVGFFHFGLNDGIYLKLGGKEYESLDYSLIKKQYKISLMFQILSSLLLIVITMIFVRDYSRIFVIGMTIIFLFISNSVNFFGFIFQAVNRTNVFSISVLIDRLLFLIVILVSLLLGIQRFEFYVLAYVMSKTFAMIYSFIKGKEIILAKKISFVEAWPSFVEHINIGLILMLANLASIFILGISRFFIDNHWGIEVFGKVSLALSLTFFFLTFINQFSMVLFPTLRQIDSNRQKEFYLVARSFLRLTLPLIFLIYLPLKLVLEIWLPQFQQSFQFLFLLLPICLFDGKMQLTCNTFFKVLRQEKYLLRINIITAFITFVLAIISVYIFNNIYFAIFSITVSIGFRSIISELYLSKLMKHDISFELLQDVLYVIIFLLSNFIFSDLIAFIVISLIYILFLCLNVKDVLKIKKVIFKTKI